MRVLQVLLVSQIQSTKPLSLPTAEIWKQAIEALQINPKDEKYHFVFKPIEVNRYGKITHLRMGNPPYEYILKDGRKRFLVHKALGLKEIKAWVTI